MIEQKQIPADVQALVSVDPGALGGWAYFLLGIGMGVSKFWYLHSCGLARTARGERPARYQLPSGFKLACIGELPQHQKNDTAARTNNLYVTSMRLGMLAESTGADYLVTRHPHEWKGNVDKELHNARCLKRLSDAERIILNKATRGDGTPVLPSELNNVIDAIGLGLMELRRW